MTTASHGPCHRLGPRIFWLIWRRRRAPDSRPNKHVASPTNRTPMSLGGRRRRNRSRLGTQGPSARLPSHLLPLRFGWTPQRRSVRLPTSRPEAYGSAHDASQAVCKLGDRERADPPAAIRSRRRPNPNWLRVGRRLDTASPARPRPPPRPSRATAAGLSR